VLFESYGQDVGDQYIVGPQPESWGISLPGPYGCCAYAYKYTDENKIATK